MGGYEKMKRILLFVTLLMATLMASCGEKPKVLVIGSANFNGDFHNGWTNSAYDNNIRKLIWGNGLLSETREGDFVDSTLLSNRSTSKSDPSKETDDIWKFTLKKGLKFSNGNPLTVEDVRFTYEFYMATEDLRDTGGSSSLNQYVDRVETDSEENSVTFYLKEVMFTTDASVFATYILDSKTITEGAATEGITSQQWVKANINKPIGYGPYKIVDYVESQYVKLEANENYPGNIYGENPRIKTLIVQNVPDETMVTQLLSGEVDLLAAVGDEEKINAIKTDSNITTNNYFRHGGGQITFHTDYGPVQLKEVRHAFAYMFDRVKFRSLFLGKYSSSSNAPYSRNMWMMYEDGENFGEVGKFEKSLISYDILDTNSNWDEVANYNKAMEQLDMAASKTEGEYAKLTKSADGKYLWEGEELTLNLAISSFWADAINLTLTKNIQEKFGIKVNLESMDWSVMASHLYGNTSASERKYHMFTGGTGYAFRYDPYANWSEEMITPFGQGTSRNSARFASDPELLDSIRFANPSTEEGMKQYKDNWRKWIVSVNEELPLLPLYSNNYFDAYTNKLEDFNTNALWQWPYAIVGAKLAD